MNDIESLMCTLEELGSLTRVGWDVRIRYHFPGQGPRGFGRVIFSSTFSSLIYLLSVL